MNERPALRQWAAPAGLAAIVAVFVALLYGGVIFADDDGGATAEAADEPVAGTKRWPGTYEITSQAVVAGEAGAPDVTIDVNVFMFGFDPSVIRVQQGQVVKLILHGLDDGQLPEITGTTAFSGHGFAIGGAYDIWITGLRKGTTKEVVFEAAFPGEYRIECAVLCGVGHPFMAGKFVVEEAR